MSEANSIPDGFRVIPGFPRYAINEFGTVLSVCNQGFGAGSNRNWSDAKRLTIRTDKYGYHRVLLRHDGRLKNIAIHTLVLTTFVGPRKDGMQCRHLDGNQTNNHISNLAWGTAKQNNDDMVLHGTSYKGESVHTAKLTANDVLKIRMRAATGEPYVSIAEDYSVTSNSVSQIVRGLTWKHI